MPRPICLRLERHTVWVALALARANAGNSRLARMAMMAITTSNSMSVNATKHGRCVRLVSKIWFIPAPVTFLLTMYCLACNGVYCRDQGHHFDVLESRFGIPQACRYKTASCTVIANKYCSLAPSLCCSFVRL